MDLLGVVGILFIPQLCKFIAPIDQTGDLEMLCPVIFQNVLDQILHDATDDKESKELTVDSIQNIFLKYGESEVAENYSLLNDMLLSIADDEREGFILNKKDILENSNWRCDFFNIQNEAKLSTNFSDIIGDCGYPKGGTLSAIGFTTPSGSDSNVPSEESEKSKKYPLKSPGTYKLYKPVKVLIMLPGTTNASTTLFCLGHFLCFASWVWNFGLWKRKRPFFN